MTYTPVLTDRIEREMEALSPQHYLRSGYSCKQFTTEFSRLIARARKDRAELKAAGFDLEKLVYYEALLDALCLAQAARRTADSAFAATTRQFAETLPAAKRRYRYLSAV